MDVAADDDWGPDWDYVGLFGEDFLGLRGGAGTFSQRALISASGRGLQVRISSICLSRWAWSDPGAVPGVVFIK